MTSAHWVTQMEVETVQSMAVMMKIMVIWGVEVVNSGGVLLNLLKMEL